MKCMLMDLVQQRLTNALLAREQAGLLRSLHRAVPGVDFYSNDYLGFTRSAEFRNRLSVLAAENPAYLLGTGGSRLIAGDTHLLEQVEEFIARQHNVERALMMPSGYQANAALFASLPQKKDTILLDERVHRSVYDGCRMSLARRWKFRHNDLDHLQELLRRSSGQVWIGVESLYSMDGDFAPLAALVALAQKHGAALIVDEAHAIGTFGLGLLQQQNLQQQVFASIVTYSKAMGLYGAAILGSDTLIRYLVNFAAPVIYSTGMPDFHALAVKQAYTYLKDQGAIHAASLKRAIAYFNSLGIPCTAALDSPIKPIRFNNSGTLTAVVGRLREEGLISYAIKAPTVARGMECIRVSLHAFNSPAEIDRFGEIVKTYLNE